MVPFTGVGLVISEKELYKQLSNNPSRIPGLRPTSWVTILHHSNLHVCDTLFRYRDVMCPRAHNVLEMHKPSKEFTSNRPRCGISPGFPQIPSKFPRTFKQIFKVKVVPRTSCLSKRNHFLCTLIFKEHFVGFNLIYSVLRI